MTVSLHRAYPALRVLSQKTVHYNHLRPLFSRSLHYSSPRLVVKPFLLADIGEGITECQLIQWFVQPGARVEQFDKLCEVQSDKASVEITSPFDGVITKLYHEPDDMAITGRPLVDIDIQGEVSEADAAKLAGGKEGLDNGDDGKAEKAETAAEIEAPGVEHTPAAEQSVRGEKSDQPSYQGRGKHSQLATPAVRHLIKEHNLDIADVRGTGKDGRVLKEDVHLHISQTNEQSMAVDSAPRSTAMGTVRDDRKVALSPIQMQMFKTMTRSLHIPHFLYSATADMSALTTLRKKLNGTTSKSEQKLTHLAFILKAVSIAFTHHPLLNSSLDTKDAKKPELTYRSLHNFGVAIDSPSGLVVPVIKHVQGLSVVEVASTLRELSEKARANQLSPQDFSGATFTISNIGSIGGGVVSPVISEPQVAILGIGRSRIVPAFTESGELVKREEVVLSWAADHRVVDGAECARTAEQVRRLLEEPAEMMMEMR
nr:lipoamide acyltransferase component [Quercus suber]